MHKKPFPDAINEKFYKCDYQYYIYAQDIDGICKYMVKLMRIIRFKIHGKIYDGKEQKQKGENIKGTCLR